MEIYLMKHTQKRGESMKWLLLVPVVIIILLLSYVKLTIKYIFYNGKSNLKISTSYLFGLIKPEIIPDDNKDSKEKSIEERNRSSILKYRDYKNIFQYIFDKVIIEKLSWRTKIGLEDPFYLSMIYGSVWWIKSLIVSYILSRKETDKLNIEVLPCYNTNLLDTRFNCIIKIRMVYIINIWIRLLKIHKGGEKNDRTSNRRLDEDNDDKFERNG